MKNKFLLSLLLFSSLAFSQDRAILYELTPAIQGEHVVNSEYVEYDNTLVSGACDSVDDAQACLDIVQSGMNPSGQVAASSVTVSDDSLTGVLANSGNVQEALDRIDNTGLGAQPRQVTGSFFATYFAGSENTNTWYGGRQTVHIRVEAATNGQYTFRMPSASDMTSLFNDLATRNLGEIYTLTIEYAGGNTGFVNRNRLTVTQNSVSNGFPQGTFPTVLAQGQSATFRIERAGGVAGSWERLGIEQAANPVPTFGEFVFRNTGWNNMDNSILPSGSDVLKGYAFPVFGSSPDDGTLRQGLLDGGVSDRTIHDGDYVVWTADSFTSWLNGDDWFVFPRNQLDQLSRDQADFLAQVTEIDNRVDVGFVQSMTNNALVWLSENPLAEAPFLTPGSGSDVNPRPGDSYPYVGGLANRNAQQLFQFGANFFQSYLTIGITPNFIAAHPESTIDIVTYDSDFREIGRLNLANDFTFRDDGDFTNSTVRHYTRSSTFNYPSLAIVAVVLTQVQDHYRLNPQSVDVRQNIPSDAIIEPQLSPDVREKLNRALPEPGVSYASIAERLMRYRNQARIIPDVYAQFMSVDENSPYPQDLTGFTPVSPENPRYQATDTVLFIATPGSEGTSHVLTNTTTDTPQPLNQSQLIESFTVSGTSYFVYKVTGITSGNRYEVSQVLNEQVVAERTDIATNQDEIERINARLSHAALNLPDEVVEVLENEVTVTKQSNPVEQPSQYNLSLSSDGTQAVFKEASPGASTPGVKASEAYSLLPEAGKKLVYFNANQTYTPMQGVVSASDGATTRDLIRFGGNDVFNARVRVSAIPASTRTVTLYPAPATHVSGAGIWQPIPTLTFQNGVPVPEADELFFTRNLPTSPITLNVMYRSLANGNEFVNSSFTLAGVGGSSEVATSATFNDGSESATLEIRYYPNFNGGGRAIRASVTEQVYQGLPTINDVEVILSYTETRTVPGTTASTRDVPIESLSDRGQVFAFVQNSDGSLSVIGDNAHVNLGWQASTLFGATGSGNFIAGSETATFFNYQRLDLSQSGVRDLENHLDLPQFGLFTTNYTNETDLNIGVTIKPSGLNISDLPTSATGLSSGDVWFNGTALQFIP